MKMDKKNLKELQEWEKNGALIQWYENGQKEFEGNYKNGKKTGL